MASRRTSFRWTVAGLAVLLMAVTVFFNQIVSNLGLGRFDLTEDKIYTVSESAKRILSDLSVPVQVKYYVTPEDQMPAGLKTLQQEVTDKLDELAIASDGLLQYQILDPSESEEIQTALAEKGIRPFQVQSVERDAVAVKLVYSAISIGYMDKPEGILPQLLPESLSNFEYELLSNVLRIARDERPMVAIFTAKEPIDPQMMQFYMQMGQEMPPPQDNFTQVPEILRSEGYDVRPIDLTENSTIPEDAQTIVLLGPREMDERQRYEIGKALHRGASVILAVQGMTFDYNPSTRGGFDIAPRPHPVGANDLLSEYGIRVDDRVLMDSQFATLAIPRTVSLGGLRMQVSEPVQAPVQIRVLGDGVNRDTPLTAGVPELLYLWGTQLIADQEAYQGLGLTLTPILQGGPESWIVDRTSGALLEQDLQAEGNTLTPRPLLAALIEGQFPDPWAGQDAPLWPGQAPDSTGTDTLAVAATPAPGRLLVVGCSKMFEDMLISQQGHGLFALNCVDAMTLGEDLITIRSKLFDRRSLGEVSDAKRLGFRLFNMALVPVIVIVIGLIRMAVRRRESEEYAARYAASTEGK